MRSLKKIYQLLTVLQDEVEQHAINKRDKWESRSEKYQESDSGQIADEQISDLEEIKESIESAADHLANIVEL